jgi:aminoglycoside phosphotransferase/GTP:adenosylcobinamide-phosphate guanylyltransferase
MSNAKMVSADGTVEHIIIQAGGKGTRLGALTRNKPKGIVPVNNLPIIFHLFRKYPDKRYIIIGDYKHSVLEKYLTVFCDVKWMAVKADTSGTCAGISQALQYVPDGKRFLLIWSDLILGPDVNIDTGRGNLIGISNDFECRWSYADQAFSETPSKDNGVAGFFVFDEKSLLADVPKEGEFVRWLQGKGIPFEPLSLAGTREIGTMLAYQDSGKPDKGFRCRAFNDIQVLDGRIVKKPIDDQGRKLAVREISWYKKAQELGFGQIPEIYSIDPLTMERIHGTDIFKAQLTDQDKRTVIDHLVAALEELHGLAKAPADAFSVMEAYITKTMQRLDKVRSLIPLAQDRSITINGTSCRNPYYCWDEVRSLVKGVCIDGCKEFAFIHGDCTFSNTMVDDRLNVVFLDPRGYFGFTELYGDPYYDWAKVYYSLLGDYDQFNNGHFELDIGEAEVKLRIETNGWKGLAGYYTSKISCCDKRKLDLIHAIIWLSLTTYIWEDYDSICGAFYNGCLLLEEVLKEAYG